MIKSWIKACDEHHGSPCCIPKADASIWPMWVIDVVDGCIVEGGIADRYLTLSYVWGGVQTLQATTANIEQLRQPGSLTRDKVVLPKTIRQAIDVTQLLGERHIWIDQLSILQDDEEHKHGQIKHMAEIYANSYLTLVAVTGKLADSGLVDDIDQMLNETPLNKSLYQGVTDVWLSQGHRWPNFYRYLKLCESYSERVFTSDSDVVIAFAGAATLLAKSFPGGILYGLPVIFFDIALLWNYSGSACAKRPWDATSDESNRPPSWSWMSWRGRLDTINQAHVFEGMACADDPEEIVYNIPSTVVITPLVQWYFTGVGGAQIAIANEYHKYKHFAQDGESAPPPGWIRAESSSSSSDSERENVYITPAAPRFEFRFPIPLVDSSCSEITIPMPISNRITCQAEHAYFYLRQIKPIGHLEPILLHILDTMRESSGVIRLPGDWHESHLETEMGVELIAISTESRAKYELYHDDYFPREHRKPNGIWDLYNVLWIEWTDGVAYRKAVGQVTKAAWEAADRELIDVVLG
ncbi:unnamed protein product [Alternaria alternata]